MRKTLLAALAVSASIGGQVFNASAIEKVGDLSFALTDTYQYKVYVNNVLSTNSINPLLGCAATVKYTTATTKITTATVITAINNALVKASDPCSSNGKLFVGTFTSSAKLAIDGYDNIIPAPAYPTYFAAPDNVTYGAYNGPRADDTCRVDHLLSTWNWANVWQIDWVNYDESVCSLVAPATGLHPRAEVFVVDTKNANPLLRCYNVTPFFSFEEAYCYFCWDTADRVTSGSIKSSQTSDICLGTSACSLTGSGTTKFYLKIKFNNYSEGAFGNFFLNSWYSSANCAVTFTPVSVDKWLNFSVDGVVTYPWTIKNIGGSAGSLFVPMGTMTMGSANGYANNPYCGVLTGSVKITETTDAKLPVACRKHDLSEYIP